MKKFGFSLFEILTALIVLGIIGAITAPIITNMMPNQKKVMIKRAYNITTNVVNELASNTALFSPYNKNGTERVYEGFDDTQKVVYNGITYSGKSKFVKLFLNYVGVTDISSKSCAIDFKSKHTSKSGNFSCSSGTTKNGITWYVVNPDIDGVAAFITADVNGDKKPNCAQTDDSCSDRKENFDRFTMQVMNDGEILINKNDSWAKSNIDLYSNVGTD